MSTRPSAEPEHPRPGPGPPGAPPAAPLLLSAQALHPSSPTPRSWSPARTTASAGTRWALGRALGSTQQEPGFNIRCLKQAQQESGSALNVQPWRPEEVAGGAPRWAALCSPSGGSGASRGRSVDRKGPDAWTGAPRRPFPSYGLAWAGLAEGGNAEAEPRPPLSALSLCLLREPLPPVRRDRQLALRGLTRTRPPRPPPRTWPSVPRKPSLGEARPEAAEAPVRGRAGRRPPRGLHPPSAPDQEGRGRPGLHELCAVFPGGRQTGRRRPVGVSGPAGHLPPSSRGPWRTAAAGATLRPFPHFPLWPPDDSRPLQLTGVTCGWHRASQAIPSSPLIARA